MTGGGDTLDEYLAGNVGLERQFRFANAHYERRALLLQNHAAAGNEPVNGQRVAPGGVLAVQAYQLTRLALV